MKGWDVWQALEQRLRQASEALELVRAQEQEQMKAMEEASEAAFTRLTAQFQEEAARKLGQLEASQRAQEARLVRREEQSTLAQSGATLKAWRTRLEDAERAEEAAQAELRQAGDNLRATGHPKRSNASKKHAFDRF